MMRIAKGGKRKDLGDAYYRSSWESNYARYLAFLVKHGKILAWEYEPTIFYFPGVKRNPISYTPDFKVVYPNGEYQWHEIKGWMDSSSRSKLKRMAQFYPAETITVIDRAAYEAIAKWARLIGGWEHEDEPNRSRQATRVAKRIVH